MKIALFYRHFPMAIGRYFDMAFRNLGHEVITIGPFSGGSIPWGEEFHFEEYAFPPDIDTSAMGSQDISSELVLSLLASKDFLPDVIIQISDGSYIQGKFPFPNVIVGTDPHCINYLPMLQSADLFACMQKYYMDRYSFANKVWVPYAYADGIHQPYSIEKEYDVVFVGIIYPKRKLALEELQKAGLKVLATTGYLYEEYAKLYSKGKISFNWSSELDTPARFFEGMAMNTCVVTNKTPDMDLLPFEEGRDYLTFTDESDIVRVIKDALLDDKYKNVAASGFEHVLGHTYEDRANSILKALDEKIR